MLLMLKILANSALINKKPKQTTGNFEFEEI